MSRILVVEDDRSTRQLLTETLKTAAATPLHPSRGLPSRSSFADRKGPASASLCDATARHPSPAFMSEGWWTRFTSWNRIVDWLGQIDGLQQAA